jgi:hypothetical protein
MSAKNIATPKEMLTVEKAFPEAEAIAMGDFSNMAEEAEEEDFGFAHEETEESLVQKIADLVVRLKYLRAVKQFATFKSDTYLDLVKEATERRANEKASNKAELARLEEVRKKDLERLAAKQAKVDEALEIAQKEEEEQKQAAAAALLQQQEEERVRKAELALQKKIEDEAKLVKKMQQEEQARKDLEKKKWRELEAERKKQYGVVQLTKATPARDKMDKTDQQLWAGSAITFGGTGLKDNKDKSKKKMHPMLEQANKATSQEQAVKAKVMEAGSIGRMWKKNYAMAGL